MVKFDGQARTKEDHDFLLAITFKKRKEHEKTLFGRAHDITLRIPKI
jgi:hypothetical protein